MQYENAAWLARRADRTCIRVSVRNSTGKFLWRLARGSATAPTADASMLGDEPLGRALQGRQNARPGRPASATAEVLRPNGRGWRPHIFPVTLDRIQRAEMRSERNRLRVSGAAIRASPAGRSCWSPPMRRPAEHGQRGKAFSSICSTATFRRSPMRCRWIWARMSRGLISDDDLTAKIARLRNRIAEASLHSIIRDDRGRLVPVVGRNSGRRLRSNGAVTGQTASRAPGNSERRGWRRRSG